MFLHQKINVLFIKNSNLSEILCLNNYCPLECDSLTCYIIKDLTTIMGQGRLLISVNHTFADFNTYENLSKKFFGIRV
jgi:hypothetical protein